MLRKVIDQFIKNKDSLSEDEYALKRLVVVVLFILFVTSLILSAVSLIGYARAEDHLLVALVCSIILVTFVLNKNDLIPYSMMLIAFTAVVVWNINITGDIFSYNHKWFFPIAMFVAFVKRKWFFFFFFVVILFQLYFFYISSDSRISASNPDITRMQELADNITFFMISFAMLFLFERLNSGKTRRLTKSQELLKVRTEELLESNQELERFAYIASHDIKTPLRNIISFSSLLERELKVSGSNKSMEYLDYVKSGSQKLNMLVEDLLAYSKLSSNSLHVVEEVDMYEVGKEIESQLSDFIQKKNAVVNIEASLPKIRTQRIWIRGLFQNLIENGLKYNESPNPTITVSHSFTNDKCIITFKDNGIGINEKYHQSIFEMFSRLHADAQFEGTGLGLAFCKKTVEKLGGQIELDSQLGKGCEFRLIFNRDIII